LLFNLTTPNPARGATHVAPKPVFMATAAATRLLEGSESLGAVEYLAAGSWGYAFGLGDERILALWSRDDRPRTITVPTGTGRVTLFDPMGNATELACEDGMVHVAIDAMPIWIRGVAPTVLPFASDEAGALELPAARFPGEPLTVTRTPPGAPLLKVFGDDGWTPATHVPADRAPGRILVGAFRDAASTLPEAVAVVQILPVATLSRAGDAVGATAITIANRTPGPLAGSLVVRFDQAPVLDVALAVPVRPPAVVGVDNVPPGAVLQAVFTAEGGASVEAELSPDGFPVTAERRATPPVIDGATSDWFLEDFTTYRTSTKRGEIESRVAIGYDDTALYMAVRTKDRSHYQQSSPANSWQGDSIQVGLAIENRFERGQWHKLCLARHGDRAIGYCHEGPKTDKGKLSGDAIPHAVVRDGDDTVYEFAFPWQRLGADAPPPDLRVGLVINDVDLEKGQPTPRVMSDVFGGMRWSRPADFGLLRVKAR